MSSSSPATVDVHSQLHLHQSHTRAARTRFYAHRVRESLTSRIAMFLCSILLTLLFISGIIILILWLSLRPHRPRFYLSSFSTPSFSAVTFDISDRNPNSKIAIYYSDISATVFYDNQQLTNGIVQSAFYQPPKNTTEIVGQLVIASGQNIARDASIGRVSLRLELNSIVQFKLSTWDTHHHNMHISCDLAVGSDGNLLPEFQGERCSLYFG
ncbi:NDR1/HIN1-like protein 2 [Phalaenopsis equestris]|uniref:NDR1/HIN1-like protein 2 n=1 Tax=Phalaenopsis equestris TaxID=78828 RepID=UPI0009E39FB3|nr:NDR1/HIN1-like protein 2 [Phalaenopsis equestris]